MRGELIIPNLNRSIPLWPAVELLRNFRHLRNGVEQHFGWDGFPGGTRIVLIIQLIGWLRDRTQSIHLRVQQRLCESLQVITNLNHMSGQCFHERFVRCGIGLSKIVNRLNQPATEIVRHKTIDDRSGEERIVTACHPLSEDTAAVATGGYRGR